MSSTASNYDMPKLLAGSSLAVLAFIFALGSGATSLGSLFICSLPLLSITVAYGIMMFASSYVEEEHHFWYWMISGWVVLLYLKR